MPWIAGEGQAPAGVAICLSGGGLRSAAFSLGALQALQQDGGLLYGPKAADLLVAVSGGSYTAAAFALTASALPKDEKVPPLAEGSPEAAWIGKNCQYIFGGGLLRATWRLLTKFTLPLLVNIAGFAALFVWLGFFIADFSWVIVDHFGLGNRYPLVDDSTWGTLADVLIGLALATWGLRAWYSEGWRLYAGALWS